MQVPTVRCVQMADQDTSCSMDTPLVIQEHPPSTGIRIKLSCAGSSKFQATLIHHPDKKTKQVSKKARRAPSPYEDPEILEMIRGRPEDDQYIYLDVETGLDDDDEPFGTSTDEAWTPSAKVNVRERSTSRPSRLNARRGVIETSLANAAARLHHVSKKKLRIKKIVPPVNQPSASVKHEAQPKTSAAKCNPKPPLHPTRKGHKTAKQRLAKAMKISLMR